MTIRSWTIAIDPTFGIGAPEDFPPDSDAERPIHVVETVPVVEALRDIQRGLMVGDRYPRNALEALLTELGGE